MPRYRLAILVEGIEWFPVEAESPEAARAVAKAYVAEGGSDFIADVVGEVRVGATIWQEAGQDEVPGQSPPSADQGSHHDQAEAPQRPEPVEEAEQVVEGVGQLVERLEDGLLDVADLVGTGSEPGDDSDGDDQPDPVAGPTAVRVLVRGAEGLHPPSRHAPVDPAVHLGDRVDRHRRRLRERVGRTAEPRARPIRPNL